MDSKGDQKFFRLSHQLLVPFFGVLFVIFFAFLAYLQHSIKESEQNFLQQVLNESLRRHHGLFIEKKYREFFEALGTNSFRFSAEIRAEDGVFRSPTIIENSICSTKVLVEAVESPISIELCKETNSNLGVFYFIGLFLMLGLIFYQVQMKAVELKIKTALVRYFLANGITLSDANSPLSEIVDEIQKLSEDAKNAREEADRLKELDVMNRVARQVSHDIRSPLGSLLRTLDGANGLNSVEKRLANLALQQITGIANGLLNFGRKSIDQEALIKASADDMEIEDIWVLGVCSDAQSLSSSRVSLHCDPSAATVVVKANSVEFKRLLSNLLNNALEASDLESPVILEMSRQEMKLIVNVKDNGKGMSKELVERLGHQQVTDGKATGNGLGVWHATRTLEAWDGRLSFSSEIGVGTVAHIEIPVAAEIDLIRMIDKIRNSTGIMLVGGTSEFKSAMRNLLTRIGLDFPLASCQTKAEGLEYYREHLDQDIFYLVSQELADGSSGLDFIQMISSQENSALIYDPWENPNLVRKCSRLGIIAIPQLIFGYF